MFRFLYFSGLVRRNSFANVVFAVCNASEVRFGVPKWLRVRGFAWRVAAVAGRSVGFIGCDIGFCCHVRAVSGWERGCLRLVCFFFGFKKEGDVSRRSHAKENIRRFQARLTFLYFVFRCLRGAKVVFFLFVRVFSWRKNSVFFVCSGENGVGFCGFRVSNAAFADFEAVIDVFFRVVQHGGKACGVPDCGVEGREMGVSAVGFEELGDVKGVAVRQDLLIECGSADAVEGFAV